MDHENFMLEIADKEEQFAISYELLCLLRWMIEYDTDKLKKMITRAVNRGLNEKIERIRTYSDTEALDNAHENIIEFFSALETMLLDTIQEQTMNQAFERKLMPAIDQIDTTVCDDVIVQVSLEKANSKISHNPEKNPQDILLTEILKNWKPSKKEALQ